jgi:16S rRNA (guanine(527)-N(7))-methyltransferase RsmG
MESAEGLKRLLDEWEIPPDSLSASRMTAYLTLLTKWNARINLTASTEWPVIEPMFREAIWTSRLYPADFLTHLDIGSGAGFPALLIKILVPRMQLELVESRERKGQFLEAASSRLGLDHVSVRQSRLKEFLATCPAEKRWDCVSWKALKLGLEDLSRLHARGLKGTRFFMYHGKEPALENADAMLKMFSLDRKERIPGTKDSHLSIYTAVEAHS